MNAAVAEVAGLRVVLTGDGADVLDDLTFAVRQGEILAVVGESGSGKTTVGTALLGHARRGAEVSGGTVTVAGVEVFSLDDEELRSVRGTSVARIPQDPGTALNPALRIGGQLREVLRAHRAELDDTELAERIDAVMADVRLPSDLEFLRRYPHQLSGGQQQRVCTAMAFLLNPKVVVLDEPTTGLDVTTQSHVLRTIRRLCAEHGVAAVYISHDLAVVSGLADRVLVLYAGRVAELGDRDDVLEHSAHPYTRALLGAIPDISERRQLAEIPGSSAGPGRWPQGCRFSSRCPMAVEICHTTVPPAVEMGESHISYCHRADDAGAAFVQAVLPDAEEPAGASSTAPLLSVVDATCGYGAKVVVPSVSLEVRRNECLAIVGESGSGKSTLTRTIAGLIPAKGGGIDFDGRPLARSLADRSDDDLRRIQYVFQNPYASLNPRKTVGQALERPLERFRDVSGAQARGMIGDVLERVALSRGIVRKFPDQLSGGERQRVAVARALVCEPDLLICDEVTSALDVSAQAAMVNLLRELMDERGLALLFVTHDLGLVRTIAERTVVLVGGKIVESGSTKAVLETPQHEYTRALIADTPTLETTGRRRAARA